MIPQIPKGDWIIVTRAFNDTTSRGFIRKSGLTEDDAKFIVEVESGTMSERGYDMWAMHKDEY